MSKKVDIVNRYSRELMDINNKLHQLEKGRIYNITGVQADGYLSTNTEKLREMIEELIYKVEYNEESDNERLKKAYDKYYGG